MHGINDVLMHGINDVQPHGRAALSMPYRKPKSISSFIAGYKSSVTTKINNLIDQHVNTHGCAYQNKNPNCKRILNNQNIIEKTNCGR